jgi:IS1 family transposase
MIIQPVDVIKAYIERLNNTFGQRINRLVRKILSFSKKEHMINLDFKFFAFLLQFRLSASY